MFHLPGDEGGGKAGNKTDRRIPPLFSREGTSFCGGERIAGLPLRLEQHFLCLKLFSGWTWLLETEEIPVIVGSPLLLSIFCVTYLDHGTFSSYENYQRLIPTPNHQSIRWVYISVDKR